jgi:hypothetical protein
MFSPEFTGGNLRVLSMAKIATICNEQNEGSIISPFFCKINLKPANPFSQIHNAGFLGKFVGKCGTGSWLCAAKFAPSFS